VTSPAIQGKEAAALLDSSVFRTAVEAARQQCFTAWADTPPEDTAAREVLYHQFRALGLIQHQLWVMVSNGQVAIHRSQVDAGS